MGPNPDRAKLIDTHGGVQLGGCTEYSSDEDEPGAPAQPPPAVASVASDRSGISVDNISELSLDELVDKAFPPDSTHTCTHALALILTLALTRPSHSSLPCCGSGAASTSPGSLTSRS